MNVCSLVGTRPQFLKLAALDQYIKTHKPFSHFIVHSGQHFDREMSDVFFNQLNISMPDLKILRDKKSNINNLSHIMNEFEIFIMENQIDLIIVFGDCDTTLAGAIVANKLGVKLAHIESGMRSFNKQMPEENNRKLTDHLSDFLFCPDSYALQNLNKEDIYNNIKVVGNLQIELLKNTLESKANNRAFYDYSLLTIHRDYNTNKDSISKILQDIAQINKSFIFPVHPRTKQVINLNKINVTTNIHINEPFGYIEMAEMLSNCDYVITDSGGVQLESWYLNKKCIVMRTETEWIDPIKSQNSILHDPKAPFPEFVESFLETKVLQPYNIPINTSEMIISSLN